MRLKKYQPLGKVTNFSLPQGSGIPGYDAAVVELHESTEIPTDSPRGVANLPNHLRQTLLGRVLGAVSGTVNEVGIVGTLSAYSCGKNLLLKNSWILSGSADLSPGGSGSAFALYSVKGFGGMIISGSSAPDSGKRQFHFAHDLASIEKEFLRPNYEVL